MTDLRFRMKLVIKTDRIFPLFFVVAGCASAAPVEPPMPVVVPSVSAAAAAAPPDENDPMTYVEQLQNPRTVGKASTRLVQLFEDAMTKDSRDPRGPNVKPLLDKIVEPLVQICVAENGGNDERLRVIKLLVDSRDPRSAPCFLAILDKYETGKTEEELSLAARGAAAMKLSAASGALFKAFAKMDPTKHKGTLIYRELNEAMVEMSDPSWENPCLAMLATPTVDRLELEKQLREAYRQLTCAQILGNLRSEKAVPSLAKVMLSPGRSMVQSTAINALIKIGKPAISLLVPLLNGNDKELVEYAKAEHISYNTHDGRISPAELRLASNAYVYPTAVMLGSIGLDDAIEPMTKAISKADEVNKVFLAREMLKLPLTPASMQTVKTVYETTPLMLVIPPGMNGRGALLEQLGFSFDSQLVPWLVKDTLAQKGDDDDLEELRGNAYVTAMKLAKFDQVRELAKIGNLATPGGSKIVLGYLKEFKAAKVLLNECRDKLECYLAKLVEPDAHVGENQFIGIKSAYMLGVLGGPDVRAKIVELLPNVRGDAARFVLVQVIDHFSPKGDKVIAEQLKKMLEEAEASKDKNRIASFSYFRQFSNRLEARAQ